MTAPLELRYRRLLAVYPAVHRRAYEEEMVGVLMAGAEPGRRRPTLGETVDLLRSGIVARLGRGVEGLRGAVWRDAAAVVALFGAVLLAAVAGRRLIFGLEHIVKFGDPMRFHGVDGGLLIDVTARAAAWLAVLVAVLLAARRTAVALGVVALLVEIATIVVWLPAQEFRAVRMSWAPILALLTVGLLVLARRARPALQILGRRSLALLAGGLVLTAVGAVLLRFWTSAPQILGLIRVPDAVVVVAGVLVLTGLRRIPARTRRRTLVLLAPVFAVPVAQQALVAMMGIDFARSVTPGIIVATVLLMAGIPLLAFALASAALYLRESMTITLKREAGEEASRVPGQEGLPKTVGTA